MEELNIYNKKTAKITLSYVNEVSSDERIKIKHSDDIVDLVREQYKENKISIDYKEAMFCVYLNRTNQILAVNMVSVGGTSGTICDPKVIFQEALLLNASAIILAHNHPSGNLKPSKADITLTQKINQGAALLDMQLLDHLIITAESSFSITSDR